MSLFRMWENEGEAPADPLEMSRAGNPADVIQKYYDSQVQVNKAFADEIDAILSRANQILGGTSQYDLKQGRAAMGDLTGPGGAAEVPISKYRTQNRPNIDTIDSGRRAARLQNIDRLNKMLQSPAGGTDPLSKAIDQRIGAQGDASQHPAWQDALKQKGTGRAQAESYARLAHKLLTEAEAAAAYAPAQGGSDTEQIGHDYKFTRDELRKLKIALNKSYTAWKKASTKNLDNIVGGVGDHRRDYTTGTAAVGRVKQLEKKVQQLSDQLATEKSNHQSWKQMAEELSAKIEEMKGSLERAGVDSQQLLASLDKLRGDFDSKQKEAEDYLRAAFATQNELEVMIDRGGLQQQRVADYEEEIRFIKKVHEDLGKYADELENRIEAIESKFVGYRKKKERTPKAKAETVPESFDIAAYLKRVHKKNKIKHYDGDW